MLSFMTIRLVPLLLILGLILGGAGLILGYSSISRDGVSCGSALSPNDNAATVADLTNAIEADNGLAQYNGLGATENACKAAVSDRKPMTFALLVPGIALLLGCIGAFAVSTAKRGFQDATPGPQY